MQKDQDVINDIKLTNLANSNIATTRVYFEGQINSLKSIVTMLDRYEDLKSPEVISLLNENAEKLGYERMAIDFLDAISYTSDGDIFDVSSFNTTERTKNGETFILDIVYALLDNEPIVSIYVPIYRDGVPYASLRAAISSNEISEKIGISFTAQQGFFHLIDNNGKVIASSRPDDILVRSEDFYREMKSVEYEDGNSYDQFLNDVKSDKSGYMKFKTDNTERNAYYSPVGINDWVMISIVPREVINNYTKGALKSPLLYMFEMALALFVIFLYILWKEKKYIRIANLDEKCFRVLSEQTGSIILEIDGKTEKVLSVSNFKDIYEMNAEQDAEMQYQRLLDAVYYEDSVVFKDSLQDILKGVNTQETKIRIMNKNSEFVWYLLTGVMVEDENNKPYKSIISIKNIDESERESNILRDKAQKDLLTDILNRVSSENLITQYIKDYSKSNLYAAFLILDLDNFKGINDNLGHQFGDKVLKNVASKLKGIFRKTDIIGRIGGDEFIIFMENIKDLKIVDKKAKEVLDAIDENIKGDFKDYHISASLGVSIFPQDGKSFDDLYALADLSLYEAKKLGKNNYIIFNDDIAGETISNLAPEDYIERFIANHFSKDIIYNIFEMLYETKDIKTTIKLVLQMLGEKYNCDRCYIYYLNDDATKANDVDEWCARGISSVKEKANLIGERDLTVLASNYSQEGLLCCDDITKLSEELCHIMQQFEVKSVLQCGIFENDKLKVFVGYDSCTTRRVWTSEGIANIVYITRILSTFIIKQRSVIELEMKNRESVSIQNEMSDLIYVVDWDSYEILFENENVKKIGANIGDTCYRSIFGNN